MIEVIALVARAGDATVSVATIEDGTTVRVYVDGFAPIDAVWLRSPDGQHHGYFGGHALNVRPALPPPPAPVTLVLVSAGTALEVDLR